MSKVVPHIVLTVFSFFFFLWAKGQDTTIPMPPVEMSDTSVYETSSSTAYQFKEVSGASRVHVRTVRNGDLEKIKSDDDYWYADLAPKREKKKEPSEIDKSVFDASWFRTLFWILLIGGFVALLVWFLATGNVSLFRRRAKTSNAESIEEIETEDIFELNFEKEIRKAIEAANYRMAVRVMYLRALRDLSLKELINYTHEKTNSDYLFQLADSPYYKNFFSLTRDFDYTWYGHFPLSQESFAVIENDFNNFKKQLS